MLSLDRNVYHPTHGPQSWPWWRLISIRIVKCTHDPAELFWLPPISYNAWLYSRWGAVCITIRARRGVYRRA